ncbi:hypothetical protein [Devosia sp. SL43]|uniref:hypothetical protein n=1 Tax=Devosia sp. SL43 TaxID=2806348 RepID=UPI001F492262|nr:hypothetical protein [Devosia sp. SL43]UJW85300.1 hypothetical protein IM737_18160 [Devosia sp. SL43]
MTMHSVSTQEIRDDVMRLLEEKYGLDNFEAREMLGMMFCQAVVEDSRLGEIVEPNVYMQRYSDIVLSNIWLHQN